MPYSSAAVGYRVRRPAGRRLRRRRPPGPWCGWRRGDRRRRRGRRPHHLRDRGAARRRPGQLQLPGLARRPGPGPGRRARRAEELQARCNAAGRDRQVHRLPAHQGRQRRGRRVDRRVRAPARPVVPDPRLAFFTGQTQTGCGRRQRAGRAVLLPARPGDLLRAGLPRAAPEPVRRPGHVRAGLHRRPRVRPPPADPARHRAAGPRGPAARPVDQPTRTRSPWSCRPTATPGCGRTSPTSAPRTASTSARTTSPRRSTPPRRSATTGSRRRSRAGSTRSPGPTARPSSASTWFLTGYSSGDIDDLRHVPVGGPACSRLRSVTRTAGRRRAPGR